MVLCPLLVDMVPLIEVEFEDNHPLISIRLYNKKNKLLLHVDRNELSYSIDPWDIEFESNRLTIRRASRDIAVKIEFNPPNSIGIVSGTFYLNGIGLKVNKNGIVLLNDKNFIDGYEIRDCWVGIAVNCHPNVPAVQAFGNVKRITFPEENRIWE